LNELLLCWEKEDTGAGKEGVWKKGGRGHGGRGVALGERPSLSASISMDSFALKMVQLL